MLNAKAYNERLKSFNHLCRGTGIVCVILALCDIAINLTMMIFHLDPDLAQVSTSDSPFVLFRLTYLNDAWFTCSTFNNLMPADPPRQETGADSTFIWVCVYLVLDVIWIIASIVMDPAVTSSVSQSTKRKRAMYEPWALITSLVLLYEMAVFIVFIIDIQYASDLAPCLTSTFQFSESTFLMATLVIPLYFIKGGIIWLALVTMVLLILMKGKKIGSVPSSLYVNSPASAPVAAVATRDSVDMGASHVRRDDPPAELRVQGLALNRAEERRVSEANWVYANDSYEPDVVRTPPWEHSKAQPMQFVPAPQANRYSRAMSEMSVHSEAPSTMGLGEFNIPRAKPVAGPPRKPVLRTPSGRSVRASEYLQGYTPTQTPIREYEERTFEPLRG